MARIRSLKPGFFTSESLAECDPLARLTFTGLWCYSDDEGRGKLNLLVLKGAIWPFDDEITAETIGSHLEQLSATGHITIYEVAGRRYFEVVNFEEHQAKNYRPGVSKLPKPSEGTIQTSEAAEKPSRVAENPSRVAENASGREGKVREGKGREGIAYARNPQKSETPDHDADRTHEEEHTTDVMPLARVIATIEGPRHEDLWTALAHELGPAATDTEKHARSQTLRELKQAGATPEQIHERCTNYRNTYPAMALTDKAITKHWSAMAKQATITPKLTAGSQAIINLRQRLDQHA